MSTPIVPPPTRRLAVLHAVPHWLPQTATWLHNQVRFLPDSVESHVFCETAGNLDQFPVENLHVLRRSPARFFWDRGLRRLGVRPFLGAVGEVARRTGARILHSHFGNVGAVNVTPARNAGLAHAVTFYGLDVTFLPRENPRWLDRYCRLFATCDRVFCEGPHMGRTIEALGCPGEKIRVHHLGVAVDEIPFRPRRPDPGSPVRVLLAGSFREKKGFPIALTALGRIRERFPLEITIIGDAPADERGVREKARILEALRANDLEGQTRLLGYQPHRTIFEEAERHHVFLSPSIHATDGDTEGGAPVSIIEMAASGMAIVSTTHCDIPEVVLDGKTGLLAPEGDVDGLAARLEHLLGHSETWPEMLRAGRDHVEREFDARRQGAQLAGLYEEIIRDRSAGSGRA